MLMGEIIIYPLFVGNPKSDHLALSLRNNLKNILTWGLVRIH